MEITGWWSSRIIVAVQCSPIEINYGKGRSSKTASTPCGYKIVMFCVGTSMRISHSPACVQPLGSSDTVDKAENDAIRYPPACVRYLYCDWRQRAQAGIESVSGTYRDSAISRASCCVAERDRSRRQKSQVHYPGQGMRSI